MAKLKQGCVGVCGDAADVLEEAGDASVPAHGAWRKLTSREGRHRRGAQSRRSRLVAGNKLIQTTHREGNHCWHRVERDARCEEQAWWSPA